MPTYIALLRGINVSGQKLIKMEQLRTVLHQAGLLQIRTYIQSGNILLESEADQASELKELIHNVIKDHFLFDVPVTITTPAKLKRAILNNPFASETISDPTQPYIAFLSETPLAVYQQELLAMDFGADRLIIDGDIIYLHYANSAGKTRLTNNVIEKKLKVGATSRNWKTVCKLAELAANDQVSE